jgi:hypothetical protein
MRARFSVMVRRTPSRNLDERTSMRIAASLLLAACLLAGCGGVYTTSPASDKATTRDDDRLVGFWRAEGGSAAPLLSDDGDRTIFVIGKDPKSRLPRLRTITLLHAGDISENDCLVRATSIGGRDHVSIHGPEGNSWWTVFRYEVLDVDTIRVLAMDENKVAADVKSGVVSGQAERWTTDDGKSHVAVTLDGSTAVLRQYVERRGDEVYATDRPLVLRRVRMR